ncbi:DUF4845 domain-containing protein [Wenzhouxiangella sp. XN79A]|uniref:DUF4845 domain-containing protein n=1 Tax=Wenzhouxiangella sp. XN79A TaxID=2724193 RepID=UPI00144A50F9|nr:DUF4845 domain-containing protein [Wenzhouxiangella sp. XN79A]NKI34404.1 DUF4845 domain-containing protein [Wenzhouxiangella sp. XN79A]
MKTKRQMGMTLIGFLLLLSAVIFVAYIGMKLVPIYMNHYNIVSAMKDLAAEPGSAQYSERRVRDLLSRKLSVNYVRSLRPDQIELIRSPQPSLKLEYEVREDLIGNIDVVVSFNRVEVLN